MTMSRPTETTERPLTRDLLYAARYYLSGRRGLALLAAAALVAGVVFNWSWLVAAGIAPLLLIVLPCVAMCALGLCMNRTAGRSCSSEAATPQRTAEPPADRAVSINLVDATDVAPDRPTARFQPVTAVATTNSEQPQPLDERRISDA